MSAAGTLSVQQQACARPTLIFVVGWFLPEVREFLFLHVCSFFEEIYLVGTLSQKSNKALYYTRHTKPIINTTRGGRRARNPKTTLPHRPPGPLATAGLLHVGGGRPQACFGSCY